MDRGCISDRTLFQRRLLPTQGLYLLLIKGDYGSARSILDALHEDSDLVVEFCSLLPTLVDGEIYITGHLVPDIANNGFNYREPPGAWLYCLEYLFKAGFQSVSRNALGAQFTKG